MRDGGPGSAGGGLGGASGGPGGASGGPGGASGGPGGADNKSNSGSPNPTGVPPFTSATKVTPTEDEDAFKNLKKTFANIFGDM